MSIRIIFSTILYLTIYSILIGQSDIRTLSPKNMKKDVNVLLETMDAHPDPYTKISKDSFNLITEEILQKIEYELDEIEFYKCLSKLVSSIHDGHTSLFMPSKWLENQRKKNGVLPFTVYLSDNLELFVVESYDPEHIEAGVQILAINDVSISDFVEFIDPYVSYELLPFRNDKISRKFELYLYLRFKTIKELELKVLHYNEKKVRPCLIDFKKWKELKKEKRKIREKNILKGRPYNFKILKPGIAKIDIYSFHTSLKQYNFFLNNTFKEIKSKKIHSLIIDVRGNYGGYPKISSELFHYIHQGHFKTMAKSSTKISFPYRKYFTDKNPYLTRRNFAYGHRQHKIDLEKILKGDLDTYANEDAYYNEAPRTEIHEFYADCYLLTDRRSYSAASSFASTFQCYNMGYVIGEPTGGTTIFRANAFSKVLPKSQFVFLVSTTKLFTPCYNEEDQPITPDIIVTPTINERVHMVDSQLNMALLLIKKLHKRKKNKQP